MRRRCSTCRGAREVEVLDAFGAHFIPCPDCDDRHAELVVPLTVEFGRVVGSAQIQAKGGAFQVDLSIEDPDVLEALQANAVRDVSITMGGHGV